MFVPWFVCSQRIFKLFWLTFQTRLMCTKLDIYIVLLFGQLLHVFGHLGCVIVSVLVCQTKDYEIGICCFSIGIIKE